MSGLVLLVAPRWLSNPIGSLGVSIGTYQVVVMARGYNTYSKIVVRDHPCPTVSIQEGVWHWGRPSFPRVSGRYVGAVDGYIFQANIVGYIGD